MLRMTNPCGGQADDVAWPCEKAVGIREVERHLIRQRRDPSVTRPTTPSQHGPATGTGIRILDTSELWG